MQGSPITEIYKTDHKKMQPPLLYLGLMGFDAPTETNVRTWLAESAEQAQRGGDAEADQHPMWQVVDVREADALLICGAGVKNGFGSHLQFDPTLQTLHPSSPLGADLESIKLPFAISDTGHLQDLGLLVKDSPVFDTASPASLLRTTQHFEVLLRPLRSLFALAVELTERRDELSGDHTYHLEHNGALNAIIDAPKRRVFMRPNTRPEDIHNDAWMRRPRSANFAPAHFLECSMDEVAWVFAMHSAVPNLPKRYESKPIHVRRNPRVRTSLLYPRHAVLLDRLWQGPVAMAQLQTYLPDTAHLLKRDLFGLYITHSISTSKATQASGEHSSQPDLFDNTSPWSIQHLSRRMNTMAGELQSLF
jgi:hypothetical protein